MTRILPIGLFFALSLVALTAVAQDAVPENGQTQAEERREAREERRALISAELQDRIVNLTANVTTRLTAVIDRFSNIVARLDSRTAKLKDAGIDTTLAETKLSEAKRLLVEISVRLEGVPSVRNAVVSQAPRESFRAVRTELSLIRDDLREVHALLRETVALLKEAVRSAELGRGVSGAVTEGQTDTENEGETPVTE